MATCEFVMHVLYSSTIPSHFSSCVLVSAVLTFCERVVHVRSLLCAPLCRALSLLLLPRHGHDSACAYANRLWVLAPSSHFLAVACRGTPGRVDLQESPLDPSSWPTLQWSGGRFLRRSAGRTLLPWPARARSRDVVAGRLFAGSRFPTPWLHLAWCAWPGHCHPTSCSWRARQTFAAWRCLNEDTPVWLSLQLFLASPSMRTPVSYHLLQRPGKTAFVVDFQVENLRAAFVFQTALIVVEDSDWRIGQLLYRLTVRRSMWGNTSRPRCVGIMLLPRHLRAALFVFFFYLVPCTEFRVWSLHNIHSHSCYDLFVACCSRVSIAHPSCLRAASPLQRAPRRRLRLLWSLHCRWPNFYSRFCRNIWAFLPGAMLLALLPPAVMMLFWVFALLSRFYERILRIAPDLLGGTPLPLQGVLGQATLLQPVLSTCPDCALPLDMQQATPTKAFLLHQGWVPVLWQCAVCPGCRDTFSNVWRSKRHSRALCLCMASPSETDFFQIVACPRANTKAFVEVRVLWLLRASVLRGKTPFSSFVQMLADLHAAPGDRAHDSVRFEQRWLLFELLTLLWETAPGQVSQQAWPLEARHDSSGFLDAIEAVLPTLRASLTRLHFEEHRCDLCDVGVVTLDAKYGLSCPLCNHRDGGVVRFESINCSVMFGCQKAPLQDNSPPTSSQPVVVTSSGIATLMANGCTKCKESRHTRRVPTSTQPLCRRMSAVSQRRPHDGSAIAVESCQRCKVPIMMLRKMQSFGMPVSPSCAPCQMISIRVAWTRQRCHVVVMEGCDLALWACLQCCPTRPCISRKSMPSCPSCLLCRTECSTQCMITPVRWLGLHGTPYAHSEQLWRSDWLV